MRRKMNRKKSRKNFKRGNKISGKNLRANPLRGGWRL